MRKFRPGAGFGSAVDAWRRSRTHRYPVLLVWAVAATLPVLVLFGLLIYRLDMQEQREVEMALRRGAETAVQAADRILAEQTTTLQVLGRDPDLEAGRLVEFRVHAERVFAVQPEWLGFRLTDARTGQPVFDLVRPGVAALPEPIASVDASTGPNGVGIVQRDPALPEPFVVVDTPNRQDGPADYVLSALVRARSFSEPLLDLVVPQVWTAVLLDHTRTIVARTREEERFVGTPAPPSQLEALGGDVENFFFALDWESNRIYVATRTSKTSGWTAVVGAPAALVEMPRRRALVIALLGGAAALLLASGIGSALLRAVAARRAAETALAAERTAERRLSDIAANFPGVIYRSVLAPDGRLDHTYFSPTAERLFGGTAVSLDASPADALPATLHDTTAMRLVHPDDRAQWLETIRRSAESLQPFAVEGRLVRADGSERWVHHAANTHRDADGVVIWDGLMLDITEVKHATAALRASEARLRAVVAAAADGILTVDEEGRIEAANPAAESIFGYAADELVGRNVGILAPDDAGPGHADRLRRHVAAGRTSEMQGSIEIEGRRKGGTLFPVEISVGEARADGRRIFAAVIRDITARKRADRRLREALTTTEDLLRQRETLLREVHHRVKNNFQVIVSLLVLEAGRTRGVGRERLTLVRQRIATMARLHERLYASGNLARIEFDRYLDELVHQIADLYKWPGVRVVVDADALCCDLEVALPLGLIVNELVTNSLKHAFPDGRPGTIKVALRRDAATGGAELTVADDGIGSGIRSASPPGIGTVLTDAFARQLRANRETDATADGTRIVLRIPDSEKLVWPERSGDVDFDALARVDGSPV